MTGRSIRRRLLAGVALVQLLAVAFATTLVVDHERERSYALLEAGLVEHAAVVESVIQPPDEDTGGLMLHRELLTLPKQDVYVLSDSSGNVIASSGEWRASVPLPDARRSFMTLRVGGRRYRALVLHNVELLNAEPDEVAKIPKLTLVYAAPLSQVREQVRHVAAWAVGLGLAILLASLAATGWVVRTGLRPLVRLAEGASSIDEAHWHLHPSMPDQEAEELAPLSLALTHLLDRLRAAFERERRFSADAAHEMKTAVAIVKSTLQLALERDRTGAQYRLQIERALEDTERMQALVTGMLQLARFESLSDADLAPPSLSSDAAEEVEHVLRRFASVLEGRRIQLKLRVEALPGIRMPSEELHVVITNLLENALQYSPDGAPIEISIQARDQACLLRIEDHGCGIDPAALPHIFERFFRGDPSRSRQSGGNGLGLAVVKAIVEKNGGSIHAESALGRGSVFVLRLPLTPPPA